MIVESYIIIPYELIPCASIVVFSNVHPFLKYVPDAFSVNIFVFFIEHEPDLTHKAYLSLAVAVVEIFPPVNFKFA